MDIQRSNRELKLLRPAPTQKSGSPTPKLLQAISTREKNKESPCEAQCKSALSKDDLVTLYVDHIVGYQNWLLSSSASSPPIAERVLRVRSLLAFSKNIWTLVTGQRPIFTYPVALPSLCP